MCLWVCYHDNSNFACINPHQTGFVGKGSDHLAVPRLREGGLWRDENFWLRLTTAGVQCLHLSEHFFHLTHICLFINRITHKVGHDGGTSRLYLSDLVTRSRSLEVKRSKSFLQIIPFKIVRISREKKSKCSLFLSMIMSVGPTVSMIGRGQRSQGSGHGEIDCKSL